MREVVLVCLLALAPRAFCQSKAPLASLPTDLSRAIDRAGDYLERTCDPSGRFVYRVDTESGRVASGYNIVRHAGAIYALAMLNHSHPNQRAVDAMLRAAKFLDTSYISADGNTNRLVVWSKPIPRKSEASLGAAGLGLVALTAVEQVSPKSTGVERLEGLGRFLKYLQRDNGRFFSKYDRDRGAEGDWDSLYYPGEAALGLVSLYEADHSREWLIAAGRALSYLAKSRAGSQELPPDHWALIATAKFLPYYDTSACPASRSDLIAHASRICESFLREQITNGKDARLDGGFDLGGRTTPSATRLEGLLAALEFLPPNAKPLRSRIEAAVQRGIAFLLRAQIASSPFVGGMPRAVIQSPSAADSRASEIRVDYVQHAMCAWLRYQTLREHRQ